MHDFQIGKGGNVCKYPNKKTCNDAHAILRRGKCPTYNSRWLINTLIEIVTFTRNYTRLCGCHASIVCSGRIMRDLFIGLCGLRSPQMVWTFLLICQHVDSFPQYATEPMFQGTWSPMSQVTGHPLSSQDCLSKK